MPLNPHEESAAEVTRSEQAVDRVDESGRPAVAVNEACVFLLLLASCVACAGAEPRGGTSATEAAFAGVEVVGVERDRERRDVLEIVDAALRKNGDLGAYGDLSTGLVELERLNHVRINPLPDGYWVGITPRSGEGHDLSFRVDPHTLALHGLVVGEIAPRE